MNTRSKLISILLTLSVSMIGNVNANTISYTDFSDVSGIQLNGDTTQVGNVLRLTNSVSGQSGSAFVTTPITLANDASFSTTFQFQISNSGGFCDQDGCGADGIVFTLQNNSNTAGSSGGGIGYSGIGNSIGIELDTWNNGPWDNFDGNHVGINLNGNINPIVQTNLPTGPNNVDRLNNGVEWSAWIDYNGILDSLEVRVGQGPVRPTLATLVYTVDLPTLLGTTTPFIGFTSGTGGAWGDHDITSWELHGSYQPFQASSTVPLPSTIALMLLGLVGVYAMRRRATNA